MAEVLAQSRTIYVTATALGRTERMAPATAQTGSPPARKKPARNQTIDVLRGLCIVMMITGHVGTSTYLNQGIHFLRFVSGAEGFVFLAGLVMGFVYRRKMETGPIVAAYRAIWKRAATIWAVHCILVLLVVSGNGTLYRVPDVPTLSTFPPAHFLSLTASLRLQPGQALNILPLYVFLLGAAPLVFELLRRRLTVLALTASVGTLVYMQYHPDAGNWLHESSANAFPPLFWQGLFVPGMCLGYHYHHIRDHLIAPRRKALLIGLTALTACIAIVVWVQTPSFAFYDHLRWDGVIWERHPLRLGRVAYFLVAISALYLLIQQAASRVRALRPPMEALALLGRNSLYAFLVHIVIAVPLAGLALQPSQWIIAEAVTAMTVAAVYLLARYQVGRPWVPN
jgi:hypothetical protein